MRIDGVGNVGPVLQGMLGSLIKGERFQADAAEQPAPAAPAAPPPPTPATPQPATSVQMLVALASIDPVIDRRRKQAVEADRGLSMLERLRNELAAGMVPPERLRELEAWADAFTPPDDPVLAEIGREIELRVRVELAKLDLQA